MESRQQDQTEERSEEAMSNPLSIVPLPFSRFFSSRWSIHPSLPLPPNLTEENNIWNAGQGSKRKKGNDQSAITQHCPSSIFSFL
jgi:hypothetical protein